MAQIAEPVKVKPLVFVDGLAGTEWYEYGIEFCDDMDDWRFIEHYSGYENSTGYRSEQAAIDAANAHHAARIR